MIVVGQFSCGTLANQADSTPNDASFTVTEPSTLSLGQNNNLSCAWSLTESFCARTRNSAGTTSLSKTNAAPDVPTNPRVNDIALDPAVSQVLWPVLTATSNDTLNVNTNQISQSRTAEVNVYSGASNTVIWNSGLRAFNQPSGEDFSVVFPSWRPPRSAIVTGAGDAIRRIKDVYWFGRGTSPLVHILNLDQNIWTSSPEIMAPGDLPVAWSDNDAVVLLPDGDWLRVTAAGTHLAGSDGGGTITWDRLGSIPSFPNCSSVRLSTLGNDSSRALLWCRSSDNISASQLHTYELNAPVNLATNWTASPITANPPVTVAADFQAARLGASHDYRIIPGTGNSIQILGGRLEPGGLAPSWTTAPTGTGENLSLSAGCGITAQSDTTYLVLSGANEGWSAVAAADPSNDVLSSADLPGGQTVNGTGNHLARGDADHDAVVFVWHPMHGLRPIVWVPGDEAYSTPPDPQSGEAALIHNNAYTWAVRFTDQGGLTGTFPANANDRHGFSISIP